MKRVKQIPSDKELCRRLWNDPDLREACDLEDYEKPHNPSPLTRFRGRIGMEKLQSIMNTLINEQTDNRIINGGKIVLVASSKKAAVNEISTTIVEAVQIQKHSWRPRA